MYRSRFLAIATAAMALTTGCSSGGRPPALATAASLAPPTSVDVMMEREHRIGVSDVLDVTVLQLADLTRTVQVDDSGRITLPLIGQVPASGKTGPELEAVIARALSAKYMQSPQVTVTLKEAATQKVTLDGEVREPGVYPVRGRTTLLQAVALAKGPTDLADLKTVVVFRQVQGSRMAARFDLSQIRKGLAADPEIFGNDTIVVDSSGGRKLLKTITAFTPLAVFFTVF